MQQMPLRIARTLVVGAGAYAGYVLLDPYGLGWFVLPLAGAAILSVYVYQWLRARRLRREIAKEEAWSRVGDAGRPAAIAEVRAAVLAAQSTADRVRLTVLLSDLVDAEGAREEAQGLLLNLELRTLPAIEGAVVRHALATLRIRDGDAEGAREVLTPRAPRCGDEDLDWRLELLDATADIELGEAERALATAIRVRRAANADEALALEARVVRAAALDARGDHDEAISALIALGPAVLEALTGLGGPRIRDLAQDAQNARAARAASDARDEEEVASP